VRLRGIASRSLSAGTDPDLIRKILDHVNRRAPAHFVLKLLLSPGDA